MLQAERSAESAGRLENLAELTRAMEDYESLPAFLEHVSLVMDNDSVRSEDKVTLMTIHAAKGLEFEHVFLAGWEEGVFPSQRSLDEGGLASLEEERRLAYVALTRARKSATILHAANRRIYGQWTSSIPSRFVAELPKEHVESEQTMSGGESLWRAQWSERADPFAHVARAGRGPGWQRAVAANPSPLEGPSPLEAAGGSRRNDGGRVRGHGTSDYSEFRTRYPSPLAGEGDSRASASGVRGQANHPSPPIEAKASTISLGSKPRPDLTLGQRVFHSKFGYGTIAGIEGNKLEIDFEHAGRKRVLDSFVSVG